MSEWITAIGAGISAIVAAVFAGNAASATRAQARAAIRQTALQGVALKAAKAQADVAIEQTELQREIQRAAIQPTSRQTCAQTTRLPICSMIMSGTAARPWPSTSE